MHGSRLACTRCGRHRPSEAQWCPNCGAVAASIVPCRRSCCQPVLLSDEAPMRRYRDRDEFFDDLEEFLRLIEELEPEPGQWEVLARMQRLRLQARDFLMALDMERAR